MKNPRGEPRWDRDYTYGRRGELQVNNYLDWIACGNGRVETKRKSYIDLELYIELECDYRQNRHVLAIRISVDGSAYLGVLY